MSVYDKGDFIRDSLQPKNFLKTYVKELAGSKVTPERLIIEQINGSFLTRDFTHTIMLYTGQNTTLPDVRALRYYVLTKEKPEKKPDWIIVRGWREYDYDYALNNYREIVLNISDDERWASSPDPINHVFEYGEGRLTLLKKK